MTDARVHVLESFQQPRATTNPYIVMLLRSLREVCDVSCFSWRESLLGRYEVFHVHWPEVLLSSERPTRRVARRALFATLLLRLRLRHVAVVRTVHNLKPHEEPGRIDGWLLERLNKRTVAWIRLNPFTAIDAGGEVATILHGHYRDWFDVETEVHADPGRLAYFGLVRPYKGVPELITAFSGCPDEDLRLVVLGEPSSPELRAQIERLAGTDPRVSVNLSFIEDGELAEAIRSSTAVVLPYREMHNSGALLLALSLGRPVLVPTTPVTEALRDEVGPGWVMTYDGDINSDAIQDAVAAASGPIRPGPDLSKRDWSRVAAQHLDVFQRAITRARPHKSAT